MMKRISVVLMIVCATLAVVSCQKDFVPAKGLMYGTWVGKDVHYRFDNTYRPYQLFDSTTVQVNGAYWNPAEDVNEDEAIGLVWTLDGADLLVVKQMYMGGKVPNNYTVTALTESSMTWKDDFGNSTTFTKK